ncbi:hypothetical protein C0991_010292 [Blastosporella zonata]|nr:hypothetical protein C0991_010292 [Blastosporella zonata]
MDELTVDGYDLQMGTNLIGHFYFTKLLLPILEATAQNSGEKHVRVLQASSVTHYYGSLDFDTFKDGPARRKLSVDGLYARSKYVSKFACSNGFADEYLAPWARIASPRADSLDPVLGNKLWEWLDEEVKDI